MFKKFPSLENTYREAHIQKVIEHGYADVEWVVTEKVHGANVSFWYNTHSGEWVKASRENVIEDESKFLGMHNVFNDELKDSIKTLASLLKEKHGYEFEVIGVYGELFGGNHPTIKVKDSVKVQKGVIYSPKNEFMAFEVTVDYKPLDEDTAYAVASEASLHYAKPLRKGTLNEVLQYPNEFNSTILNQLGYEVLEDNICEGVVLKPVKPIYLRNGDRVILKNKNEKWSEKAHKRKHEPVEEEPLSEEVQNLVDEAATFVTVNRLKNVLSKIGEVTQKDFGKVLGAFSKDTTEDFVKEFSEELQKLEKADQKKVTSVINREATKLLRTNFLNIIDGVF